MKESFSPARGMMEFNPKQTIIREFLKKEICENYKKYGYMQIDLPFIENIDVLHHSDGGDNIKLIFNILKRGEKLNYNEPIKNIFNVADLALRYDLTVPLSRFYAENQDNLPKPFKVFQIGPSFRADRPQRGRYRQFTQCDIDILGDTSNFCEIELIKVTCNAVSNLGFKDFVIKVNDRKVLNSLIELCGFNKSDSQNICIILDKYDKIGYDGVLSELCLTFEPKISEKLIAIIKEIKLNGFDALIKYVPTEIFENLKEIVTVSQKISQNNYKVEFDISIIRGQGYYTSTIYELYLDGMDSACGGGGRYDTMIEKLTNIFTPAVGFSLGFEKFYTLLIENNFLPNIKDTVALIYDNDNDFESIDKKREELFDKYNVLAVPKSKNLKNQLLKLKENGVKFFCLNLDTTIQSID